MTMLYIYEYDTKVSYKDNRIIVNSEDNDLSIPCENIDGVILFGNIQLTGKVISFLMEREIPVTWLSKTGKFFGRLVPTTNVNISRQRDQFRLGDDKEFCIKLSRKIIKAKIRNQKTILSRYNRETENEMVSKAIARLENGIQKTEQVTDLNVLIGYEGNASRIYFEALGLFSTVDFPFEKRTRRPPKDKFNSLLSFGYTLLMYDLYSAIISKGLNPYAAFLHQDREKHPTLASDLMEEWRPGLVDSMMIGLIRRNMLEADSFAADEKGGIYIGKNNIKIFIREYENKLNTKSRYLDNLDYEITYRRAFVEQANILCKAIENRNAEIYSPIILR